MANAALAVKGRIRAFMIGISQNTGAGANPALAFRRLCAFFPVISVIANIVRGAVVISAISVYAVAEIHLFSCRSFRTTGLGTRTHRSEACRTLILNQIGSEAYSGRRAVVASGVAGRSVVFVITVILSYVCIATCIDCTTRRTTGRAAIAVRSRRTRRA